MGIFQNLIVSLLYLAMLMLDIVLFFVAIRFWVRRRPHSWLAHFDRAGGSLVQGALGILHRNLSGRYFGSLAETTQLLVLLSILLLLRLCFMGFWRLWLVS